MLMHNPNTKICECDAQLISAYYKLANSVSCRMSGNEDINNYDYIYRDIKNELLEIDSDVYHLVDVLIVQIFNLKKSKHKAVFWNCFGDIVLENLKQNIDQNSVLCEECGKRFIPNVEQQKYCDDCSGYQPIETKTIVCKDCGNKFIIDGMAKQTDLCPSCYKEYRKIKIRNSVRRYRKKQKM